MEYKLERKEIADGVYFSNIKDEKFKTNRISINLFTELDDEFASANALISYILTKATEKIENMTEMSRIADKMYGAMLDTEVMKIGEYQIISFYIQTLDDKFTLDNEDMNRQCSELLCDILLNPKLEKGLFSNNVFELEKQFLINTIESEINDKRSYALSKLNKLMFKGEKHGVERLGELSSAKNLTLEFLAQAYQKLLSSSQIEIMFTGCGDNKISENIFKEKFSNIKRDKNRLILKAPKHKNTVINEVKNVTEKLDVSQSKLAIGFKMGECQLREQFLSTKLMCALLGSTPTSRLFVYVREKMSLCYYCSASYDKFKNVIFVDSGIEHENKEKAFNEILRQIKIIQDGEFEDSEIEKTKLFFLNSLNSITDSLSSIEYWFINQIILGTNITPKEEAEYINSITKEKVINSAKTIKLDTVYFLTKKD